MFSRYILIMLSLASLALSISSCQDWASYTPHKILLNEHWEFRQVEKETWYKAEVPGTVHLDLMSNGLIADPFYRTQEKDVQWVGEQDWE